MEAGVAVETVYAGFGSKRDLLLAAVDVAVVGDDLKIPLAQRDSAIGLGVGTPSERVDKAARMSAAISTRTCALIQSAYQPTVSSGNTSRQCASSSDPPDSRRVGLLRSTDHHVCAIHGQPLEADHTGAEEDQPLPWSSRTKHTDATIACPRLYASQYEPTS